MKFIESFEKFITDEVNLNKTRLDRITAGIDTVKTFLGNSKVFGDQIKSVEPQGSYRQKTITKPATEDVDFDVDLLCEMKLQAGWQPKDYPDRLHNEFKKTDRYKDIVDKRGKNRCVTLDYADDFHIDLVPAVTINGSTYMLSVEY